MAGLMKTIVAWLIVKVFGEPEPEELVLYLKVDDLRELIKAVEAVEAGKPLTPEQELHVQRLEKAWLN